MVEVMQFPKALTEQSCAIGLIGKNVVIDCETRSEAEEILDWLCEGCATATLTTENAALAARVEALEGALRTIAKCESRFPGDVVDVARAALAGDPS